MNDAMHFLRVVGALGLTAAFGAEAAELIGLRRATGAGEVLLWLRGELSANAEVEQEQVDAQS